MTPLASARRMLAALLVALVVVGCATQTQPTASPSPTAQPVATPAASSEPTAPPEPTPAPVVGWEATTVPSSEASSAALWIVPGGDGLVAVGFDGAFGSTLWTSADARAWRDVTPEGFDSIGLVSVVEFGGRLVAVGRADTTDVEAEVAAAYVSDDGLAWRRVGGEDMRGQLVDVVATDDGLFAVGGVPGADSAGVWRSTDGETWERTGPDFEHAFMWAIAEGGPGLVAVGWRRNPEPDLAVWTSTDGTEWTLAPDPDGFAGFEATDVVQAPDGTLVMVGSAFDGGGGAVWTSADGVTWMSAEVAGGMDGSFARTVARTPAGLVAVGGDDAMQGRSWISTDGRSWQPLSEPLPNAYFQSAFATEDGLFAAGATQEGTLETGIQAHATIWSAILAD